MAALVRLVAAVIAALGFVGSQANPHVPHGVRSIEIRSAIGSTSVTDRASVRKIVKWFDELPAFRPRPCPLETSIPPSVSFVFRDAKGSALLHATDHLPGLCGSSVNYANAGQARHWPLADDGFVAKVSRLLRVSFDVNAENTAANKLAAERDVARILRLLVLPPGSRRVAKSPSSYLQGQWCSGCGGRHLFWRAPLPFDSVVAFEKAHRPRGSTEPEAGFSGKDGMTVSRYVVFSLPAHGGISSRGIWVNMAPLPDGGTGIRADAYVNWVVARSTAEKVPAGFRTIEIEKSGSDSHWQWQDRRNWRLVHRVTDPAKVARIVRWFDALPIIPGLEPPACYGMPPGSAERITFLDGSGHALARTTAEPYGGWSGECYPMTVSVGEVSFPPLLGGNFPVRVEKLLR